MLVGMLHLHQKDLYLLRQMNFHGHDIYQLPVHTPEKIGMMPKFNFENKLLKSYSGIIKNNRKESNGTKETKKDHPLCKMC